MKQATKKARTRDSPGLTSFEKLYWKFRHSGMSHELARTSAIMSDKK